MSEQIEGNNHTRRINIFPASQTIFFLLGEQQMDFFAPHVQWNPLCDPLVEKKKFPCSTHGKLTIGVEIRVFPNFPVTNVEKWVLSHWLIIDRGIKSIIFALSHQGPKIAFPAPVSKKWIYSPRRGNKMSYVKLTEPKHRIMMFLIW